jgi:hypothetical protein
MKNPARISQKRRLIKACLIVVSFIGPMVSLSPTTMADTGDLENDARMEGYMGRSVVLDTGSATNYMLMGVFAILSVCVMFKDAKRSSKKN